MKVKHLRTALTAVVTAGALFVGTAPAHADVVYGSPKCNSGARGYVCTEILLTPSFLIYAHATSEAYTGHKVCLVGVALYVVTPSSGAVVQSRNSVETCSTGDFVSLTSSPEYSVPCFGVTETAYTAVRYTVDNSAVERFQSDPVQVC